MRLVPLSDPFCFDACFSCSRERYSYDLVKRYRHALPHLKKHRPLMEIVIRVSTPLLSSFFRFISVPAANLCCLFPPFFTQLSLITATAISVSSYSDPPQRFCCFLLCFVDRLPPSSYSHPPPFIGCQDWGFFLCLLLDLPRLRIFVFQDQMPSLKTRIFRQILS